MDGKSIQSKNSLKDYYVSKVSSQGSVEWLVTPGLLEGDAQGFNINSMAVDQSGNIYLSYGLAQGRYFAKLDSQGNVLWNNKVEYILNDMFVGDDGTVWGTGTYSLMRIASDSSIISQNTDIPKFHGDSGSGIARDAAGNIYIAGSYHVYTNSALSPSSNIDMLVAKYSPAGVLIWSNTIIGPYDVEYGRDISVDANGTVFFLGEASGDLFYKGKKVWAQLEMQLSPFLAVLSQNGDGIYFTQVGTENYKEDAVGVESKGNQVWIGGTYKDFLYYPGGTLSAKGGRIDTFLLRAAPDLPVVLSAPPSSTGKVAFVAHNSYLRVDDPQKKLGLEPNATIEMWIKPQLNESNQTAQAIVFLGRSTAPGDISFTLLHRPLYKDNQTRFEVDTSMGTYYTRQTVPLDYWYHVALARSGANLELFINGTLINTFQLSTAGIIPVFGTGMTAIGAQAHPGSNYLNLPMEGFIDEIRISNTTRDVIQLWQQGVYDKSLQPDLYTQGLWSFEDTFDDKSSNSLQTTSVGAISINTFPQKPLPPVDGISVAPVERPKALGPALNLGSNSWLEIPALENSPLNFEYPITIEMWVNARGTASFVSKKAVRNGGSTGYPLYEISKYSTDMFFGHSWNNSWIRETYRSTLDEGWYHVAVTSDGYDPTIFINGTRVDAGQSSQRIPAGIVSAALPLIIGQVGINEKSFDDLRISKTVRDVEANWTSGVYQRPLEADNDTVGLWHFDQSLADETNKNPDPLVIGQATFIGGNTTPSPSPTPTFTPTPTLTSTPSPTMTNSPTPTLTRTPTPTLTKTHTPTPTRNPTPNCIPSVEICDQKDNDCDGNVDEGLICQSPTPTQPSSVRPTRFPTLISVAPITVRPTIRPITPVIRPTVAPAQVYHSVCGTGGRFLGIAIPSCNQVPGPGIDECRRAFDCIRLGPVTR